MISRFIGASAVAALGALLVACGGGGGDAAAAPTSPAATPPTVLPDSVAIRADARVDASATETFTSSLATTDGVTFHWDFGDGSTGTGAIATHAYAASGTYLVTLAVSNSAQDQRSSTWSIQVGHYSNVASLACTQPASSGWCLQHTAITAHAIKDVFFTDATHAWAVGAGTTILKSADGGATWTQVPVDASLADLTLKKIRFADANNGMVLVADQSLALQTSDGGATWVANTLGNLQVVGALDFVLYADGKIFLSTLYDSTLVSRDNGQTWSATTRRAQPRPSVSDCWTLSSEQFGLLPNCSSTVTQTLFVGYPYDSDASYEELDTGAFASASTGLLIGYGLLNGSLHGLGWSTSDGGMTWTRFTTSGIGYTAGHVLTMSDATHGWLIRSDALTAWWTADGGHSWVAVTTPDFLSLAGANTSNAGLLGTVLWESAGSRLSLSTDQGLTWQNLNVAAEDVPPGHTSGAALVPIQRIDADHLVVAAGGRFYATHDGGQTWTRILGPDARDAGANYAASAFLDAKHGSVITSRSEFLSTADGGLTWTRQDFASRDAANSLNEPVALQYVSATEAWMAVGGHLAHSTDGGAHWSVPPQSGPLEGVTGMFWLDATHGWAWRSFSTLAGVLFITTDGGASWSAGDTLNSATGIVSMLFSNASNGVASTDSGIYITTDGGVSWAASPSSQTLGLHGPLVQANGALWILGDTFARSLDGGLTWQSMGLSNYGLTGLAFADASNGWLIGLDGQLLHTADGGKTWTAQPVGSDLDLLSIAAVDSETAWIVTRDGAVLATATAGF